MAVAAPDDDFALLDRYVRRHARTIPGYLRSLDLKVIAALGRWQSEAGLAGDLAEIGVHHGRLFLALAALRRPGEKAVAIDLFEDDALNSGGRHAGRATALAFHARRLSIPLAPSEIVKSDSTKVTLDRLRSLAGPLRLISVDGAHTHPIVGSDLALAADALADHGIIALDDFANADWPDVRDAAERFLRRRSSEFGPFLLTRGKLYLARRAWLSRYADAVEAGSGRNAIADRVSISGRQVMRLRPRLADRVWNFASDLAGVPSQRGHRTIAG